MRRGTRYLTRSLLRAANTANARRPFDRHSRGSIAAFFLGWLTSELPLHTIAIQAVRSGRDIAAGALGEPAGVAGAVVDLAQWAELVRLHRVASGASAVFTEALASELGAGWEQRIAPWWQPQPVASQRARIVQPFELGRRTRCAHRGVVYGPARRNHLDIWQPKGITPGAGAPVLLQVHGGAWTVGNKEQQGQPLMAHMTDQGWVCVSINYSLSPKAKWPSHIVDVKRAIAWIKANIEQYGGDPDFIVITGGSAGGHLSSLAALTANDPEYQPGFEEADTTVQAAVPFYGVYDFLNRDGTSRTDMESMLGSWVFAEDFTTDPDAWDRASSMSRVHGDAPPFFVIHGTNDALAPVEQARSFVDLLRKESSKPVVFAELPATQHAFEIFWSPRTIAAVDAVARFCALVRSEHGVAD